jgi:hypothetical protein
MYIMFINVANNTSPLCILCMLMPQIIPPSYTHVSLYVVWRVHPPPPREQWGDITVVVGMQGAFCHATIFPNMFLFFDLIFLTLSLCDSWDYDSLLWCNYNFKIGGSCNVETCHSHQLQCVFFSFHPNLWFLSIARPILLLKQLK